VEADDLASQGSSRALELGHRTRLPDIFGNSSSRTISPTRSSFMAGKSPTHAYRNQTFLNSKDARELGVLAEYLGPKARFERDKVDDTIVFMGSARLRSREDAEEALRKAEAGKDEIEGARMALKMSVYYEAARELAFRLTQWSKG